MEHFIASRIEKATGISITRGALEFTPEEIKEIPKRYGFKRGKHVCDYDPRYGSWFHPKKEIFLTCSMAGISWFPKITEDGILLWVGTFYNLEVDPISNASLDILDKIKGDIFSLVTNNNGSGEITIPFRHKMR